jgi:hypothetical protein
MSRNPIARALGSPKYRLRIKPSKRIYKRKPIAHDDDFAHIRDERGRIRHSGLTP